MPFQDRPSAPFPVVGSCANCLSYAMHYPERAILPAVTHLWIDDEWIPLCDSHARSWIEAIVDVKVDEEERDSRL